MCEKAFSCALKTRNSYVQLSANCYSFLCFQWSLRGELSVPMCDRTWIEHPAQLRSILDLQFLVIGGRTIKKIIENRIATELAEHYILYHEGKNMQISLRVNWIPGGGGGQSDVMRTELASPLPLRRLERVFSCTCARKHTRQLNESKLAHRKLNLA